MSPKSFLGSIRINIESVSNSWYDWTYLKALAAMCDGRMKDWICRTSIVGCVSQSGFLGNSFTLCETVATPGSLRKVTICSHPIYF